MRQYFTITIIAVVIGIWSTKAQNSETLRIDLSKAYGGGFSEYFKDIEYIPLETTPESLLGYITQLVVTENSFIVSDFDTRCVLFFSNDGKFIRKIKIKGQEAAGEAAFTLNYDYINKQLHLKVFRAGTNSIDESVYSNEGHPIKASTTIKRPKSGAFIALGDEYFLNTSWCYFGVGQKPADTVIFGAKIYKGNELFKSLIPYNIKEKYAPCALGITGIDVRYANDNGEAFLSLPIEHLVYRVTKDTATPLYQIIFEAARTIPKATLMSSNLKFLDSIRIHKAANPNVVITIGNIFFSNKKMFFKIHTLNNSFSHTSEAKGSYNFIYDTTNGHLSSIERMTPDSTTGFLPFYNWNVSPMGLDYRNGYIFSQISSLEMFQAYQKNKFRNPKYSESLIKYFKTQSKKSNPVVIKYRLK